MPGTKKGINGQNSTKVKRVVGPSQPVRNPRTPRKSKAR